MPSNRVRTRGSRVNAAQRRHLETRKRLIRQFGPAYQELNDILTKFDAVGIGDFAENEYDLEVHAILARAREIDSEKELRRVVEEEFERWFAPVPTRIGKSSRAIAAAFWPYLKPPGNPRGRAGR